MADQGTSITVDGAGNVYTAGYFTSNVDFDPGAGVFTLNNSSGADGFISKLDMNGDFVWAKQFAGNSGSTVCNAITLDASGNIFTTGYLQNITDFDPSPASYTLTSSGGYDIFISKLDVGGSFVWAKSMGGTIDDMGEGIDVDPSGNVYTAGHFYGTVDFDPGPAVASFSAPIGDNTFILKLDGSGNYVWNKQLTASSGFVNNAFDVAVDASGNTFTTGYFGGIGDFDPSPTSTYTLSSPSAYNIFISKLDVSGNFVWACTMGSSNGSESHAIAVASGSVYTTGWFTLTPDFDPSASVFNLTAVGSEEIFILKMSDALILNMTESTEGFNAIVYPNPTYTTLNIKTEEAIETIIVYNLLGAVVLEEKNNSFSVEQLPTGVYTLQIKTSNGIGTTRFVKE
ncbi:MAG: SBBP repeat-containing protein [Sphingobacteriaceae bacterium]|nr:SBBP repeat-containing protein [Sphingobacteriaceae bacterium]